MPVTSHSSFIQSHQVFTVAGGRGLEPQSLDPKSSVLPIELPATAGLHYRLLHVQHTQARIR